MKKLLIPFLLLSSLFGIYIDNVDHLKKHIDLAAKKNFDAIGVIYSDNAYGTGTLIHPNIILTAAHVVKDQENIRFQILVDGKRLDLAARAVCHPKFSGKASPNIGQEDMPVDIALVFVDEPVLGIDYPTLAEYIPPQDLIFYATGYGGWNGAIPHYFLDRKLSGIAIIEEVNDQLIITNCNNLKDIELFASGRPGDSGGPIMTIEKEDLIHGVLSCIIFEEDKEGVEGSFKKEPSYTVYPKIHNHIDWILDTIEANIEG
jgi:hypothetical protein